MGLDGVVLLLRQPGGLVDDGVGNTDLAHVVQKAHHIDVLLLLRRIAEAVGDLAGVGRHPSGVAVRIRVLGVDGVRQGRHDMQKQALVLPGLLLHLPGQIPLQMVEFDDVPDPQDQDLRHEGLFDEIHGAEGQAGGLRGLVLVRCQEDHRDLGLARLLHPQALEGLKAVYAGHFDVQQDQIRGAVCAHIVQQRLPRSQRADPHAVFAQNMTRHFQIGQVVVHNNNPLH